MVAPQASLGAAGVSDLDSSNKVVWQQRRVVVNRHLQQRAVASAVRLTSLQAGNDATMHGLEAAPLTRLVAAYAGNVM